MTPQEIQQFSPSAVRFTAGLQQCVIDADLRGIRIPMFMAQLAHESNSFRSTQEGWGPTPTQARYGARVNLGNTLPTAIEYAKAAGVPVGQFYAGVGLLQLTGFSNILACSLTLFGDDRGARNPKMFTTDDLAPRTAAWYWKANSLNDICDDQDFVGLSARINCGNRRAPISQINGLDSRLHWYDKAKTIWRAR